MALAVQRDPDRVTGGFVEWLRDREPDQSIDAVGFERPTDGFSSETSLVDVIDNLLNRGVVLNADVVLALADVDLVYVRLSALLCAADRVLPGVR